ncbi:MAG: hypothetical protein H5T61_08845 [Thermoflexales bacterium]|nr:hypothetical protein [Thermoflexales bacterium]
MASAHAVIVSSLILALFYYWFGIADRYAIFLYEHLGAGPFDPRTVSRYWMSGLVASGGVLVVYTYGNWLWGRIQGIRGRRYVPPEGPKVWLLSLPLIVPGVLWITTHLNWPVLPLPLAAACAVVAVVGLFLALIPARMATAQPGQFLWLAGAGAGLVPALLLLRVVERFPQGEKAVPDACAAIAATLVGALWTLALAGVYARRRGTAWRGSHLLVSGFCLSYLLLPLAHYLLLTPPTLHYITVADNFFASTVPGQALGFAAAVGLAWGAVAFQRRIAR